MLFNPQNHYNNCKVGDSNFDFKSCQICDKNRHFLEPNPDFLYDFDQDVQDADTKRDRYKIPEIGKLFFGGLPPDYDIIQLEMFKL